MPIRLSNIDEEATKGVRLTDIGVRLTEIDAPPRIGFLESGKEEFAGPAKGAQYIPILGGVIGAAENMMYLDTADRLSKEYDYSKPIAPEMMLPGAMGTRPASYTTKERDQKIISDLILRMENQQRGYTYGGLVAKGLLNLPTWMSEFAMTGGIARLGNEAAQQAGTKLLKNYAKTKAGKLALKTAGWTGGAMTRATLGLTPRVVEKATERQVGVQILGADQEGWATSFAKAWGDVTIEAASEVAGETITGFPVKMLQKTKLGTRFISGLRKGWMKATGGSGGAFARKLASRGGYSNIVGEYGEERLGTLLRGITDVEDFGAGKDAGITERLRAGFIQDAKNIGVELTVLSVPMAGQVALGQALAPIEKRQQQPVRDFRRRLGGITPGPVRLDAIETKQQKRQRVQREREQDEADIEELDRDLAEIQRGTREPAQPTAGKTPSTVGVEGPELAPEEKKEAPAAETPQIKDIGDKELAETVLSAEPLSADWVKAFNEMKRRKIVETKKAAAPTEGKVEAFHGTKAKFETFDLEKFGKTDFGSWGKGIYFSKNPETAFDYAKSGAYLEAIGKPDMGRVIKVELDIKNPATEADVEGIEHAILTQGTKTEIADVSSAIRNRLKAKGFDAVVGGKNNERVMVLDTSQIEAEPAQPTAGKPTPIAEVSEELIPEVPAEGKEPWEMTREEYHQHHEATPLGEKIGDEEKHYIYKDGKGITVALGKTPSEAIDDHRRGTIKSAIQFEHPVPREVLQEYKSEKWAQDALSQLPVDKPVEKAPTELTKPPEKAPTVAATQKKELQQREAESEQETTGISKRRRGQLLKESEKQIAADPVYQLEMEGVEDQVTEIGTGFYYVPRNLRSEVEDIIGKRKGFPTKLQKMFTFDPSENATDWEKAVQEGLGRGKEGIDETAGEMDITEFVQRVKDASERGKGLLDERRVDRARASNNPYTQLLIQRRDMIAEGAADTQIDEMISAWAEQYGQEESVVEDLFVGAEPLKLKEIKELPDDEQEEAYEALARQNVLKKERDEARESITDVLKANDLEAAVEVKEVEEIREEDLPFEKQAGIPTGATITTPAGDQIVLIAYGADSETGYHEGYHVLRSRLTPKDRAVLDKHFKGDEEAEARAFAVFAKTGKAAKSYLRAIWQKLIRILQKIKSGLQGEGFRTADDIFGAIQRGTVAKVAPARAPTQFERGVFDQPIHEQQWLSFPERQKAIKRAAVEEKRRKAKPYEDWRPRGQVPIKSALVKAVDAEIQRTMKPRSNAVKTTPEEIIKKIAKLPGAAELFYEQNWDGALAEVTEAFNQLVKGGPLFDIRFETTGEKWRRESIRKAQINAEKARLKARNEPKKKMPAIRRMKIKLQDHTPPLREDLAPLPPGKPIMFHEPKFRRTMPVSDKAVPESVLERNRQNARIKDSLKDIKRNSVKVWEGLVRAHRSISTRLFDINPELKRRIRDLEEVKLGRIARDLSDIEPLLRAFKKMKPKDWKDMDLFIKNGDVGGIEKMVQKYKLQGPMEKFREVDDAILEAANEVGMEVDHRKGHFHRRVRLPKELMAYIKATYGNTVLMTRFEAALAKRKEQAGGRVLTPEEQAQVMNSVIRGYGGRHIWLSKPGGAKERSLFFVDDKINKFYYDTKKALEMYVRNMHEAIAEREFFGRETKQIQRLRAMKSRLLTSLVKLQTKQGSRGAMTEPRYKEHISKRGAKLQEVSQQLEDLKHQDITQTIGGYIIDLVNEGIITDPQQDKVQSILEAYFNPRPLSPRTSFMKKIAYMTHIGTPIQTATQLKDYGRALYRAPLQVPGATVRTLLGKPMYKMLELGFTDISVDMAMVGGMLNKNMRVIGFRKLDELMKEMYDDAVLTKFQQQAKRKRNLREGSAFMERLQEVFGNKTQQVIKDLKAKRKTALTKKLAFNVVLNMHPVARSEMTETYLKGGGIAKYMYTLRTFGMKEFEYARNEIFRDMKKHPTRSLMRLFWLAFTIALAGAGVETLKDLMRGRKTKLSQKILDSWLNMIFMSRYGIDILRREGPGRGFFRLVTPPTRHIDAPVRDIFKGEFSETPRNIPIGGEFYYWWLGEGRRKIEAAEDKSPVD